MKANPKPWLYGPNWQGIRCEARTRRGTPCQRPARLLVGRCKLHGGASTGPRTKNGLARSQRLEPSMASSPNRSGQKHGA
ncbi:MAG: HGGxSTG domain-containing protein [Planktomarina sp.]|nr:HGGxSTG domain-containing protein [Planktomarina sp.]